MGRSYGKIKGRRIYVPLMYIRRFRGPFHVYAREGKYLKLVVEAVTEFPGKEDEIYLGTAHIDIRKRLHLAVLLFLSVCHAIIEDTFIFVVIGADPTILIGTRFLMAFLLTLAADRIMKKSRG
ncbi:MAG: hypothetical protein QXQ53_06620 [Candidatus Methanosuratincola sp.]